MVMFLNLLKNIAVLCNAFSFKVYMMCLWGKRSVYKCISFLSYHTFNWNLVSFNFLFINVKNNIFKIYSLINLMYNCPVQYLKTVPCKGAADALLWWKDFLDQKCNVPFSYLTVFINHLLGVWKLQIASKLFFLYNFYSC